MLQMAFHLVFIVSAREELYHHRGPPGFYEHWKLGTVHQSLSPYNGIMLTGS